MALDRDTAALLKRLEELGGGADRDMAALEPAAARAGSRVVWEAFVGADDSPSSVEHIGLPGPAGLIPARLYRPSGDRLGDRLPLVVFLHGGGWALGDLDGYQPLVKALCAGSGAVFLSVDYRLAPEHKFPAGLDDAHRAVAWAIDHARELGCEPARMAVMGDSAGGNLATVVARQLGATHRDALAAQFLIYPVLDVASPHEVYASRMRHGDGSLLLARRDIDTTTSWYLDGAIEPDDPAVSPLLARDLSPLPPTVILTAGFDPLLDEARCYAERLRAAGVRTELRCFETTIHAFLSFGVLAVAQEARAWLAERVARYLAGGD